MEASKESPMIVAGEINKEIEAYLDEKSEERNKDLSPATSRKSPAHLDMRLEQTFDGYQSQLKGWSPANITHTDKTLQSSMESLSLGPSADSVESTSGAVKEPPELTLSKKEKKKLAQAEQAAPVPVTKKPTLSKQERRELQEAQRAAKATGQRLPKNSPADPTDESFTKVTSTTQGVHGHMGGGVKSTEGGGSGKRMQYDDPKKVARRSKASVIQRTKAQKQVALFSHLPQYERETSLSLNVGFSKNEIHPSILSLGLQYAEGKITGSNARCVALLTAFQMVVKDYRTPDDKMLSRDLDKKIRPLIQFLIDCRPHSIGMGNAIRYLRNVIATVSPEASEEDAKTHICDRIDTYIKERILFATEGIVANAISKISDGDVILTFSRFEVIESLLKRAKDQGKTFRVIIVDARPLNEGRSLLYSLSSYGIQCTYVLINAVAYIIREVNKVFLGASAFMCNGVAVSRIGTATVAMTAQAFNVPVMFCCETYKFSDRVQLDSITQNELGDPDELVATYASDTRDPILSDWRDISTLKLLNLIYDVTPSEYVTMVVTEVGMTPPSSIPVLIREYQKETSDLVE